jgi:hypothetical protein
VKPHPRIRKTVKWVGAAVTVLLVGAWLSSAKWYSAVTYAHDRGVILHTGWMLVERTGPFAIDPVFECGPYSDNSYEWASLWQWPPVEWDRNGATSIALWLPAAVTTLITAAAWRLDAIARRRDRVGCCHSCNYDRAGLAAGAVCPECGAAPASSSTT